MELKDLLFKELVRNGYAKRFDGRKVWDIANRSLLYMTDEMAESFLKLLAHPRYRATIFNTEIDLLKNAAQKFITDVGSTPCNLIDFGCGNGKKAESFIESLGETGNIRYCPVNINYSLVDLAATNVHNKNFKNVIEIKKIIADFKSLRDVVLISQDEKYKKNVILLLGSILASFDIHEYLFDLSNSMNKGDCLIIGNAIRKGDRFSNIETYKHPLFLEWFIHLIKEMSFKEDEVEYDARFENGRVEGFYLVKKDKKIDHYGKEFEFRRGDEIIVATLYKYYSHELERFCKMYFREVELIKDADEEQALVCCVK